MGVFAQFAPIYADAGLATFPVDTRHKRPAVTNWQRGGLPATRAWAEKFGDADGLGLCMGERSRIVEVDIDMAGDAALGAALERFGDTPIKIRTASDKSKAWYRHSGEGRRTRPFKGLAIDILGDGYTIAPPSYRPDLGRRYEFLTGSLDDLDRLPAIRADALDASCHRVAEAVREGERNNTLFLWCMVEARHCDDVDALIDAAQTRASAMPVPLSIREIEQTARSAWGYEIGGRNIVGLRRPQITQRDKALDDLNNETDAYWLLDMLSRYHRNKKAFAIAPAAMSDAGNPPWHKTRIVRARDILIERGYLKVFAPPNARARKAGLYYLTRSESDHNHLTPPPPFSGQGALS